MLRKRRPITEVHLSQHDINSRVVSLRRVQDLLKNGKLKWASKCGKLRSFESPDCLPAEEMRLRRLIKLLLKMARNVY